MLVAPEDVPERLAGQVERHRLALERREGDDAVEVALQLADGGLDLSGQEEGDVVVRAPSEAVSAFCRRIATFVSKSGELNVDDEAPLEAALQPVRETGDLARRHVGRKDDLRSLVVERVEGVKELVLGGFLPDDELHVVEKEDVGGPEALTEALHPVEPDPLHHLVHEALGGQVDHALPRLGARGGDARSPASGVSCRDPSRRR